ncbi:MAG TPA: hypothetical protein EYP14_02615 [Planctomycetaceae bacterium]|nr:hypothetical protein [Planctomycetaceae bacterium]
MDYRVSMVRLLAHRDRFHGKRIQVQGFLRVQFEGNAIYLCKEHAEYGLSYNAFWVSFDKDAIPYGGRRYDRQYVVVEGRFNKDNLGHLGGWQGAIEDIDRVIVYGREGYTPWTRYGGDKSNCSP